MNDLHTRQPAVKSYTELFSEKKENFPGTETNHALRLQDMEKFGAFGFPHRRIEEWKYTDLSKLGRSPFELDMDATPLIGAAEVDAQNIQFLDTKSHLSSDQFEDINTVAGQLPSIEGNATALFARAMATNGYVLNVGEGKTLSQPVSISHDTKTPGKAIVQHHTIHIPAGSKVTVIETFDEEAAFSSHLIDIVIGSDAELFHIRRISSKDDTQIQTLRIDLQERGRYRSIVLNDGGDLSRCETHVQFSGEEASCEVEGAIMGAGTQTLDHTFFVNHAVPNCKSNISFRTVLDDSATGVFQARTIVAKNAQQTDGRQMSKAVLLSDTAAMNAKPELEIYADDVACAHGATTGELDDDQVFYLQSRGIPQAEARALLIKAFLADVFDEIEDDVLRGQFVDRVDHWLANRSAVQSGREAAA